MVDFQENVVAFPALRRLQALLPRGLDSVPGKLRRTLEKDNYSDALSLANQRYARRGAQDYRAALTYACLLVGRELVVEARGLLDKAVAAHGEAPALLALTADAAVIEGDLERAGAILAEIDPADVERAEILSFVADVCLDLGDEDAAVSFYQAAIDRRVDDVEAATRLGQLYVGRDEPRPAAEAFEYGAKLAGDRTGLWQLTAELWFEVGVELRGLRAHRHVLELGDAEADEWFDLGVRFAELEAYEEAISVLKIAEDYDPFDVEPMVVRGQVLLQTGRAEEALAVFRKALKRRKHDVAAVRGIASAALIIGDVGMAQDYARRAVDALPEDPDAWHTLGVAHQEIGRHAQALEAFERALEIDPAEARYHASAALSLAGLGRFDEAEARANEALELAQHDVYAAIDFLLVLIKRGELARAANFADNLEADADHWRLAEPLIAYLIGVFGDADADLDASAARLAARADEHADALPLYLEYEDWLRLGRNMSDEQRATYETMLGVLEGRLSADELEV